MGSGGKHGAILLGYELAPYMDKDEDKAPVAKCFACVCGIKHVPGREKVSGNNCKAIGYFQPGMTVFDQKTTGVQGRPLTSP